MNLYFQFIISKHYIHFYNTKKLNIILASRTLVTVNLLNSSVVYIKTASEIISIARTSLNKSGLSSFCIEWIDIPDISGIPVFV